LNAGIHPGEHVGDWALEGFVLFLCSSDTKAVALRKNMQFLIYPNVNPIGRFGGSHVRGQWDAVAPYKNSNRDFGTDESAFELENSQVYRDALALDCDGRTVVCALDFHGQHENPTDKPPSYFFAEADALWRTNWRTRMRVYIPGYNYFDSSTTNSIRSWMLRDYVVTRGHAYTPESYEQHPCPNGVQDWLDVGVTFAKALADTFAAAPTVETPFIGKALELDFSNSPASQPVSASLWTDVPGHGGLLLSAEKMGIDGSGKLRMDASAASGSTVFALVTNEQESSDQTRSFAASVTTTSYP
jgi:hypothetical protein